MKTVAVTGGDSKFFLHILLLLDSFRVNCPGHTLYICDFGFSENEIAYLQRHAHLLPMPESLRHVAHTWYRKGAIDLYLTDLDFDAMLWIDGDCLVLSDVVTELSELSERLDAPVLACPVFDTFAELIDENLRAGRAAISMFKDIIDRYELSMDLPYVNIGVLLCRSRSLLEEWRDATLQVPPHPMFEQNVFNVLAHKHGMMTLIAADAFNVTGATLNELTRRDDGIIVNAAGEKVRVAHLTSSVDGVLEVIQMQIRIGDKFLTGTMRRPSNAVLREVQLTHLQSLLAAAADLAECGILSDVT
jgi:hypothetical protein